MKALNILCLLAFIFLSACSSISTKSKVGTVPQARFDPASSSKLSQKIYAHYESWKGVKHVDGGMGRSGIDCSGFVYLTFKEIFGKTISRTTELLSEEGKPIHTNDLGVGDLVFFKTGFKRRHVGIFIGQNQFIHVSSKRGVMLSDLHNPYWKDAFWQARRM